MTDQEKILDLTSNYAYIRGFFRGRIQMIKTLIDEGCKTQSMIECNNTLEWLDELEEMQTNKEFEQAAKIIAKYIPNVKTSDVPELHRGIIEIISGEAPQED